MRSGSSAPFPLAPPSLSPIRAHATRRFLRFVEENPQCLDLENFAALRQRGETVAYPLQPWPTFIDTPTLEAAGEMNTRLATLIKSIPERVFGNDPARLAAYYRLDRRYAALLAALLQRPLYMDGLVARGDYVETEDGFRCIEMNFGGNIGGWQCSIWESMYLRVPLFRRFLRESGYTYTHRHPSQNFFRHVVSRARERLDLEEGALRIAFLIPEEHRSGEGLLRFAGEALRSTLPQVDPSLEGEALVCDSSDLELCTDGLSYRGRHLHAISEQSFARTPGKVARAALAGTADVYNGPVRDILHDKRNLALLSEHQQSNLFNRQERATIAANVPWTREVRESVTTWHGNEVRLPDVLLARRKQLVLKPAVASQGLGVQIGNRLSEYAWREAVEMALDSRRPWIVQEKVDSLPYPCLDDQRGPCPHAVIWGLFCFGRSYGGGFLRMMPSDGSTRVINAARGATQSVIMEVAEPSLSPVTI